ncbi:MAG: phage major tail protein, TP901-1 family [Alphaproteobacteria bacterium]
MAAQQGKAILIKVDDGAGAKIPVAGLRTKTLSFNGEAVDATSADSANGWRELLAGAGVKTMSVSGSGVFTDASVDERLRSVFFGTGVTDFELVIPDFGTVSGLFQITALEYAGEYNGEATYSLSLESAGALGFTAS